MAGGNSGAAEVGAFHLLVCAQGRAFVVQDNSAGLEDVAVVGNFERKVRVLFHQQNCDAQRLINFDDFLKDRFHQNWRDTKGWFVEHEAPWFAHEGATDGEHLLFAAGKGAGYLAFAFL